ncbi:FAD-dependent monooxygenase [Nonomuraea sp. NPDC050691]|uniref:FAD-dependent monooxygenase n=1 Tax=Nonomuraea sp. NPDC050691 TaxID=3155661 RepID=UPI0033D728F3
MDADVIVAGAGPVGLFLAAELRLAGARPLVLERLAEPSPWRRSRGIGPLAAEALRRRGLGERLSAYQPERGAEKAREHGSEKDHFAWIHKIDPTLQEEPGRRGVLIWQPDLEAVLGEYAAGLGVTVRREHTVTGLSPDEDGVTVTVATPTGERRLRAAYVAGCDGGRSTVRKLAGFAFPGTPPLMTARQAHAEIAAPGALPPPGRLPGGMLLHGPGGIGTFDFADTHERHEGPVTAEELRASVRRVAGVDVTITRMGDALRFTDQARQAATYRLGRVLLAGDAAHVHSPNGGQGLNLGLMDAVNLGWKLAAEALGTAPEGLLDTYTAERHPAGHAVLHNTRAQSALMLPGPHTDALRDIVAELMDIPDVNRYFGRMLSGLRTRYAFPYATPEAHPLTGTHCPDITLSPAAEPGREVPLSRLTTGGRPLLFAPPGSPAVAAAAGRRDRVMVVEVTAVGHPALSAALVRPDGAVAWAGGPGTPYGSALLEAALRTWFGAPSPAADTPSHVTDLPSQVAG